MPYHMDRIIAALEAADLFVAIGTSGEVYPAAGFVDIAASAGAETLEINLEPAPVPGRFDRVLTGPATEAVPAWVEAVLPGEVGRRRAGMEQARAAAACDAGRPGRAGRDIRLRGPRAAVSCRCRAARAACPHPWRACAHCRRGSSTVIIARVLEGQRDLDLVALREDARFRPMNITCMPPRSSRIVSPAGMGKPSSTWTMRMTSPSMMWVCNSTRAADVRGGCDQAIIRVAGCS
jgi:hypothetical protein